MLLHRLEFCSLLSYSPRGLSDAEKASRTAMKALKEDQFVPRPSEHAALMSDMVADNIAKNIATLPFANYFTTNTILVPIPSSTLMRPGSLWVPQRLANALVKRSLGKEVVYCLERVTPLQKAATSSAPNRPKAIDHYNSIKVQKPLVEPEEILLVDDVITRGSTLLGAASKLAEVFPKAKILAFAAMRTTSPPDRFLDIYDPRTGLITLSNDNTFRRP
jgi:predicted amidophosphoribosyltransferase